MIAYVSGKLIDKKPTEVIVDVQGLGYHLYIPTSTYELLPEIGSATKLYSHHYVREDAALLFGFASGAERALFEVMLGVSGIGPKLALAALSAMSPADLRDSILEGDAGLLTRIPGVGRKTAERLIVELRDRVARVELGGGGSLPGHVPDAPAAARGDALSALETLGLSRAAAEKALRKVLRQHPGLQSADELVRLALRER